MRDAVSAEERLAVAICRRSLVAQIFTRGVIPLSGSANYCDCKLIRDTLQFAS
jgi:hypothetical protein